MAREKSFSIVSSFDYLEDIQVVGGYVWDTGTLAWVKMTQPGGGGGGGGAATIADGADVTQGAIADVAVTGDTAGTISGKLRGLLKIMTAVWDSINNRLKVDGSGVTQPVSGTFWQGTQPVSGPLTDTQLRATAVPVSGTFWQGTQPVSGPLTDAQLRATAVPVSGPLTDAQIRATPITVTTKGDLTPAAPTATSVGVTSAQAVAANASRKGLVLVNTSANRISLGFGSAAILNSGITLYPGGVFEMDECTFDLGAVNAIASVAASNLGIQEYS